MMTHPSLTDTLMGSWYATATTTAATGPTMTGP